MTADTGTGAIVLLYLSLYLSIFTLPKVEFYILDKE